MTLLPDASGSASRHITPVGEDKHSSGIISHYYHLVSLCYTTRSMCFISWIILVFYFHCEWTKRMLDIASLSFDNITVCVLHLSDMSNNHRKSLYGYKSRVIIPNTFSTVAKYNVELCQYNSQCDGRFFLKRYKKSLNHVNGLHFVLDLQRVVLPLYFQI